jgi:hypothetical protein
MQELRQVILTRRLSRDLPAAISEARLSTSSTERLEFYKGVKVYTKTGLLGEVIDTAVDAVYVGLSNGTTLWVKKEQVSTTPPAPAVAPEPAVAPGPAVTQAPTAAQAPAVTQAPARRTPTAKPKPLALAVGTKLFNPDGSLFGTVTILDRSAVAVLLADGYATITVPREQAVSMQR